MLADLILGHQPIVAVEWDAYACKVFRERAAEGWFPGLHVYEGDVRLFDPSDYAGRVDIIHAGFPCQDLSVAGNQRGLGEGTRSGLYREVLRIAGVVRSKYIYMENVSAILSGGLGTVLGDLAALGYDCRWCCLEASGVGAPHKRDRWWLLATMANANAGQRDGTGEEVRAGRNAANDGGVDVADANGMRQPQPQRTERIERGWTGDGGIESADTIGERLERKQQGRTETRATDGPGDGRDRGWREAQSGMGLLADGMAVELGGNWWDVEPDVGRTTTGTSDRTAKLKALGNGQVSLQAAVAWCLLGGPVDHA